MILSLLACWICGIVFGFLICKDLSLSNNDPSNDLDTTAELYLISKDPNEIKKFIKDNINHLSNDMRKLLIGRIQEIESDQIIIKDDLEKKFENLENREIKKEIAIIHKRVPGSFFDKLPEELDSINSITRKIK